ncbi:MAG: hypothetical protein ABSG68_07760 [Thermoguttaceae bacterium]|jgi:hypothetical protein
MRAFQLDECTNSRKLKDECQKEGRAELHRFPVAMRNKAVKDDEILRWLSTLDAPLLTSDVRMKRDHASEMPATHPGIVVMSSGDRHPLSRKEKLKLLAVVKADFPEWDKVPLANSVVEIRLGGDYDISVARACSGRVEMELLFQRTDKDWQRRLQEALRQNAEGRAGETRGALEG